MYILHCLKCFVLFSLQRVQTIPQSNSVIVNNVVFTTWYHETVSQNCDTSVNNLLQNDHFLINQCIHGISSQMKSLQFIFSIVYILV